MLNWIRKKLRETTFDKIGVGEVFATLGCTNYFVKISDTDVVFIDSDKFLNLIGLSLRYRVIQHSVLDSHSWGKVYRVPKDIQDRYYIKDDN